MLYPLNSYNDICQLFLNKTGKKTNKPKYFKYVGAVSANAGTVYGSIATNYGNVSLNTYVLADSYGTGSLMLDNNPGLAEYKKSDKWNPERKGKAIVGRREGEYINLFGRARTTKGTFKGKKIENMSFGTKYHIAPTHPSYALQMAEQWLYKTYLPNAYKLAVKNINFSKYLIQR